MEKIAAILLTILVLGCKTSKINPVSNEISIPLEGNAWFSNQSEDGQDRITTEGITEWSEQNNQVWAYFNTTNTGKLNLAITAKNQSGKSELEISLNGVNKVVKVESSAFQRINVGEFPVLNSGYQKVSIKGLKKSGSVFADISNLLVGGDATNTGLSFVKDDFYWGRRGPSVHFGYTMPVNKDIKWLYNELTVEENNDVVGSYFMANGFAEGYFGIQVNSPTERRILFSVWSPYNTDNPNSIPEDQKIILLKKGKDVYTGEFGNEGSGGQSYKKYYWKTGNTYKFLTKIEPSSVQGSTEYTAYFFAPEIGKWELIASFRRPKTSTYAKKFHSFLENFLTGTGHIKRSVSFGNQWIVDTDNNWIELTEAKYTADATARKGNRLDYGAYVKNGNKFQLSNCGFFWPNVTYDTMFKRNSDNQKPAIALSKIEDLE